jgi:hypothetical protein
LGLAKAIVLVGIKRAVEMNNRTNTAQRWGKDLKLRVSQVAERGIDTQQIRAFVEDYPLLSLGAVVASGYVLGRLISKLG